MAALTEPAPAPAWRNRPCWGVLPTADRCVDPGVHRFSYDRVGMTVIEVDEASHVVMMSQPELVAEIVLTAVPREGLMTAQRDDAFARNETVRKCCRSVLGESVQ